MTQYARYGHMIIATNHPNAYSVGTLSDCPLGSTTAMLGHLYSKHDLPQYAPQPLLYAPSSKLVARVSSWLIEGSPFIPLLRIMRIYRSHRGASTQILFHYFL